jgi:hypothetical protein
MTRPLALVSMALMLAAAVTSASLAADYPVAPVKKAERASAVRTSPYCGPRCGCPDVVFVRHREMRMGYHAETFDPREEGEPTYFYGRVRTYARFCALDVD